MDFLTDVATTIFTSKRRLNTEQLQELYRRRALIILLFAIVSLWAALSVHTDRTDSSEAASSEWVAVNYLTGFSDIVVAALCVGCSYTIHTRTVSGLACIVFGARSAAFFVLQVLRFAAQNGDEEVDEWLILLFQMAFTFAYLYFTYTGWKRFVQLKADPSGGPILP